MRDSAAVTALSSAAGAQAGEDMVVQLIPVIRRVVAARVRDYQLVDDLVQETLARVMTARHRIEDSTLAPYAVATARNLVGKVGQGQDKERRKAHLMVDATPDPPAEAGLLQREEGSVVGAALARLAPAEREVLLAHEVEGAAPPNSPPAAERPPGAIAAQLNRSRAKLRVEYLLADAGVDAADGSVPSGAVRAVDPAIDADNRNSTPPDTCWNVTVAWC